jgi:UDP-N-acetylmuramoyl-tripeptide--D-alanyl-D-alanine ligase
VTFFDPANIRAVVGGKWLRRPDISPAAPQRARLSHPIGVGIDTRQPLTGRMYIAIRGEHHDGHAFLNDAVQAGAVLLLVDHLPADAAIPPNVGIIEVPDTRRALGRLAAAYRQTLTSTRVIAVTGSAGKTTTKHLIHSVLSPSLRGTAALKSFNNDIGVPLTLLAASPGNQYVVVEAGTSSPGEIAGLADIIEPNIAVITSIGHAHIEQLGSLEGVAAEKAALLRNLPNDRAGGALAVVTADCPALRPFLRITENAILFGRSDDADLRLTGRGRDERGWWFAINGRSRFHLPLAGEHNALNAIAAVAVARRMGVADDRIAAALAQVRPVTMRMEEQLIGDVRVINDAYNANPESMRASITAFLESTPDAPRRVLILGDMLELGDASTSQHRQLLEWIARHRNAAEIDTVVLIGPAMARAHASVGDALRDAIGRRNTDAKRSDRLLLHAELTDDEAPAIAALLQAGDTVLLKASRGMALERIAAALPKRTTPDCAVGGAR